MCRDKGNHACAFNRDRLDVVKQNAIDGNQKSLSKTEISAAPSSLLARFCCGGGAHDVQPVKTLSLIHI